jgi:hypothetical protein
VLVDIGARQCARQRSMMSRLASAASPADIAGSRPVLSGAARAGVSESCRLLLQVTLNHPGAGHSEADL